MNVLTQRLGIIRMLEDAKTIGPGPVFTPPGLTKNVQITVDGTGPLSAQVLLEGNNNGDDRDWIVLNTVDLTGGNDHLMSGALNTDCWARIRCRVTAISGTNARVNAHLTAL